jgi:glycine/serine hydroxymethyltransferase
VLLDYGGYEQGRVIAEKLQLANIIIDCAVRVGTCEVTRRGMKEEEMMKIAELIKRTIVDGEEPEKIKKDVAKFCAGFQKVKYCFY